MAEVDSMVVPFVDPSDRQTPLVRAGDALVSARGERFPIRNDVPDFTAIDDAAQRQTSDSFGFKWTEQPDWGFLPEHQGVVADISKDMFGWEAIDREALMRDRVVLDAGCGSGVSINQWVDLPRAIVAVDISEAVYVCRDRFRGRTNLTCARADLNRLPFPADAFDVIWSDGVLHHTPDTHASLRALVRHLKPGGRIVFYVYVKKAPIREFVDDYLRQQIAGLPGPEAWRRMEALTKLGRRLSELCAELIVDEDVPELGFEAGRYDLQRFVYYNLFKCFWNDRLSFEHNVHVNFDWYHPTYAHRHTPDEVRGWLDDLGFAIERFHVSASGIGVVARKPEATVA